MTLRILAVFLAAAAAAGCVLHHEVKSTPERDRLEFSAQVGVLAIQVASDAAHTDAVGR
jgi:hypothetical protein